MRGERARNEGGSLREALFPLSAPISPPFAINLHSFTISLAARALRKEGQPLKVYFLEHTYQKPTLLVLMSIF